MRHAFTVDVEDWYQGIPISNQMSAQSEPRLERSCHHLLDIMAEHDVRGTFFILGSVAQHYPNLIRRIANEGHELGCHGWSHDLVYEMTPERFREETQRASAAISDVTAQPVTAYRAAYFSITARSLWALDILAELGFQCDSSIFPVHNWRYGIPDFDLGPCIVKTASGSICEIPISVRQVGKNAIARHRRRVFQAISLFCEPRKYAGSEQTTAGGDLLSASVGTRPRSSTGRILLEGAFDPLRQFESNRASIAATIDRFLFLPATRNCNANEKRRMKS